MILSRLRDMILYEHHWSPAWWLAEAFSALLAFSEEVGPQPSHCVQQAKISRYSSNVLTVLLTKIKTGSCVRLVITVKISLMNLTLQ